MTIRIKFILLNSKKSALFKLKTKYLQIGDATNLKATIYHHNGKKKKQ